MSTQVSLDQNSPEHDQEIVTVGLTAIMSCKLKLARDEIHVWQAQLDERLADGLKCYLSIDELARADRFHFSHDRDHFTVARGLLRALLGAYIDCDPAALKFTYADKGKPSLVEDQRSGINFNLSHSHGLALFAFANDRHVGIDLEYIRDGLADEKIAERFFSKSETATLRNIPAELRREAFFNCWTRKEAYIKARGDGLSMSLDEFDVSLALNEPAALLRNHKEPQEVDRWTMRSIGVSSGYVATIAVEGRDWQLKTFRLAQVSE